MIYFFAYCVITSPTRPSVSSNSLNKMCFAHTIEKPVSNMKVGFMLHRRFKCIKMKKKEMLLSHHGEICVLPQNTRTAKSRGRCEKYKSPERIIYTVLLSLFA